MTKASPVDWMQLPALRLLVAVADEGNLSRGARAVGMAQSNASRAVATLERRLGYALLNRSTRGSSLTTAGTLTVEWARDVLDAVDRLGAGAAALSAGSAAELRVGASMTVAEHLVPGWLSALRAVDPGVRATLRIANSRDVAAAVRDGSLAIGFVESPHVPGDLRSAVVATDRLAVVVPAGHPWATRETPLAHEELAATPLVEREPGSGTRAALDEAIGERTGPVAELNSNSAICAAVAAGLGPAVLSTLAVGAELKGGRLVEVPVARPEMRRQLRCLWYGARRPVGAAATLLDVALGRHG